MSTTNYTGAIAGRFSIDLDGGASYTLPIRTPPGTARMMPGLAIAYNSAGGDGLLGMGCGLAGLSTITRCAQTVAQDGARGSISYGPGDRFALDGQRLMVVNGVAYEDPAAIYHTELESWQKVVPVYGSGVAGRSGPDAFLVYARDGRTLEYGTTADAQVPASPADPSLRVWALNRVTDAHGNYLTITYQADPQPGASSAYPLRIDYTGNAGAALTPARSVVFDYEARPDTFAAYQGGYGFATTLRLASIQTSLGGAPVLDYSFAYEVGAATGRSRLAAMTEADATGAALPPTVLTWQDAEPGIFAAAQTLPATGAPWQGQFLPMDVNGDGRADLVNLYSTNGFLQATLFLSDGASFAAQAPMPVTQIPFAAVQDGSGMQILPLDVNGNGCIDLVCASQDGANLGLTLLLAQPDGSGGWQLVPGPLYGAGPGDLPWGGTLLATDVDGDGMTDLVYAYANGSQLALAVLFSNGSAFARSSADQTAPTAPYFAGAQVLAADFNGDGMSDLLYLTENGNYLDAVLFLSAGRQGLAQQAGSPLPGADALPASGALLTLDVNADGLADLVQSYTDPTGAVIVQTLCSNGAGFEPAIVQSFAVPGVGSAGAQLLPMEVNGDGLPDLVIAVESGDQVALTVLLSTGAGFALQSGVTQPGAAAVWGSTLLPADFDGDGRTDLVYAGPSAGTGGGGPTVALAVTSPAGLYPDLAATITTGLGGSYTMTYAPLTDAAVYSEAATSGPGQVGAQAQVDTLIPGSAFAVGSALAGGPLLPGTSYATRRVDFPKYVVAAYRQGDGRGDVYDYSCQYAAAQIDLSGRGWLGFGAVERTDPAAQVAVLTQYNQVFPLTRLVAAQTTSRSTDGALMRRVALGYQTAVDPPNTGPGVQIAWNNSTRTDFFTFAPAGGNPPPDATELRTVTFDGFGNPVQVVLDGSACGAPLYTFQTWQSDADAWRIGYLTERQLTADAAAQQVLTWEQTTYDAATWDAVQRRVRAAPSAGWQTTQFTYDAYGNQTQRVDPTGAVFATTYDAELATFPALFTLPADAAGQALTIARVQFPQFGVDQQQTDPNGVVTSQTVDGLGRVTARLGPDPAGDAVPLTQIVRGTDGQGVYTETRTRLDWAGSAWRWERRYLDGLGRCHRSVSLGADGSSRVRVDRSYDSRGNVVQESLPYFAGGTPLFVQRTYDPYGRLVQEVTPMDGGTSTIAENAWQSTATVVQTAAAGTPVARTTTIQYADFNGRRRPILQLDALQGTTAFTYDALGRLVQAVDPIGVVTSTTLDGLGRPLLSQVESGSQVMAADTFAYQDSARQVTQTAADGTQTVLQFDALQRLVAKAVNGTVAARYAFDGPASGYGLGRLAGVTLADGTQYAYTYDPYGNEAGTSLTLAGITYACERRYAPTRGPLAVVFPDGSRQRNRYTGGGALGTIAYRPAGGGAAQIYATYGDFNALGQPQTAAYGNGVSEALGYSVTGRLDSQQVAAPGGEGLLSAVYQRDALNRLVAIADDGFGQSFAYDAVGRLAGATGDYGTLAYAYDAGGNLTLKDGVTYQYAGYQAVAGTRDGESVFSATYDLRGGMTTAVRQGVATTYDYDAEGRLAGAAGCAFTYDHTGRRLSKVTPAGVTTWYPALGYEVTELPGGAAQHTAYLFGSFGLVASVTTADADGEPAAPAPPGVPAVGSFYFHRNQIDSTAMQTDVNGSVVTAIEYLPYGRIHAMTGPNSLRRTFSGKELDLDTGLYYFGARYYDPGIGRFISSDDRLGASPSRPDAFNRYAYVLNSPLNGIDPTGHSVWSSIDDFFQNHWQEVLSYTLDGVAIALGTAALAIPVPVVATLLSSTLLGAGLSGLASNVSTDIEHQPFDWDSWAIQLGIGAAVGLASGGLGVGTSAIAARFASTAAKVVFNIGAATVNGAASGLASQLLNNWADHQSAAHQLGSMTLIGGVVGGLGGAIGEGISKVHLPTRLPSMEEAIEMESKTEPILGSLEDVQAALPRQPIHIPKVFKIMGTSAPGTLFGALGGTIADIQGLNW